MTTPLRIVTAQDKLFAIIVRFMQGRKLYILDAQSSLEGGEERHHREGYRLQSLATG